MHSCGARVGSGGVPSIPPHPPPQAVGTAGANLNLEESKSCVHTLVLAHACPCTRVCMGALMQGVRGGDAGRIAGEIGGGGGGGDAVHVHTHSSNSGPCSDLLKISRLLV